MKSWLPAIRRSDRRHTASSSEGAADGHSRQDDEVRGREGLVGWISQTRSLLADLRFTVEVGPVVDGEMVAGRWIAEGTYQGGIPGSTAAAGTRVRFRGNDIWRAEAG